MKRLLVVLTSAALLSVGAFAQGRGGGGGGGNGGGSSGSGVGPGTLGSGNGSGLTPSGPGPGTGSGLAPSGPSSGGGSFNPYRQPLPFNQPGSSQIPSGPQSVLPGIANPGVSQPQQPFQPGLGGQGGANFNGGVNSRIGAPPFGVGGGMNGMGGGGNGTGSGFGTGFGSSILPGIPSTGTAPVGNMPAGGSLNR